MTPHSDGKTILVVDDAPMNVELMEALLEPEGFTVRKATSGEECLAAVDRHIPDLVLLDVLMPVMNGYDTCRRLRQNASLPYIPVVFITASELDLDNMIEGFNAGGDDYIRKPFNRGELLARIQAALRVKKIYDELARTKAELSRYVSLSTREMVERVAAGDVAHAARLTDATVLFSDIRGFTHISAAMRPADVFEMLNRHLNCQIEIIEAHGGTIDKLNGDEIMAVFEGPNKARDALLCAGKIVDTLADIPAPESGRQQTVGIGINTGPVFIGSLGSDTFRDFTVVGNTVNLAARLCGLADAFEVLFTETTRAEIAGEAMAYESIGKKPIKGLTDPIDIFRLC